MRTQIQNAFLLFILFLIQGYIFGQAPNLGLGSGFALFTAAGAFDNIGASTVVTGDVGTNAGAFTAFPPGTLIGQKHVVDMVSAQAAADVNVAYMFMDGITCGVVIGTILGNGQILLPNVYCTVAASTIDGDLILDGGGNANAIFIFKINGALSTGTTSNISLINGASWCNVYWRIDGAASLGTNSVFNGTFINEGSITLLQGASLFGRGLSIVGAISLQENIVYGAEPMAAIITAGGPTTFCAGDSVVLSGNVNGIWSNGATTPSITVKANGDYFVNNINSCGTATSNHILVMVNLLPTATTGSSAGICNGSSITIGGNSMLGHVYVWTPAIGLSSSTISNPVANPSASTTYTLTETISATGCQKSNSITITVNPIPVCLIAGNATFCSGQSTQLCAPTGIGYSYIWNNSSVTRCNAISIAGTVTVTVTKSGCSSTCSKMVTLNPGPSCNITGSSTICPGSSSTLCATSGYSNYLWNTGARTNCIAINTIGTYSVTVTNSIGCSSICSKTVTNPPICPGIISGDVWFDINMNGVFDIQERGINGLKVYIIDAMTGLTVATITTRIKPGTVSDNGYYMASGLNPGMYFVKFEKLASLGASQAYRGNNPNKDSDITHENGLNTTRKFTIINGELIGNISAGFQIKSALPGNVLFENETEQINAIFSNEFKSENSDGFLNQVNTGLYNGSYTEINGSTNIENDYSLIAFIYPNPVNEQLNVELWLPRESQMELNVFDQTGNAVLVVTSIGFKPKGRYHEIIDTKSLTGGHYIIQIKTNNDVINRKFIVFR